LAIASLFIFLYKNDKWLKVDNKELYNLAIWVAQSPPLARDQVLIVVTNFIKKYLNNF